MLHENSRFSVFGEGRFPTFGTCNCGSSSQEQRPRMERLETRNVIDPSFWGQSQRWPFLGSQSLGRSFQVAVSPARSGRTTLSPKGYFSGTFQASRTRTRFPAFSGKP